MNCTKQHQTLAGDITAVAAKCIICDAHTSTLRHINMYTERAVDVTVCCALWWQFNKLPTNSTRSYYFAIHLTTPSTWSIIIEWMWLQKHKTWLQKIHDVTTNDTRCNYKRYTMWLQTIHCVTTNDTQRDYKWTTNDTRCDYKRYTMWLQTIHDVTKKDTRCDY